MILMVGHTIVLVPDFKHFVLLGSTDNLSAAQIWISYENSCNPLTALPNHTN